MKIFLFCVITFEPIITKTSKAPQNDRQNLSFVKDKHTYDEKMAKKVRQRPLMNSDSFQNTLYERSVSVLLYS